MKMREIDPAAITRHLQFHDRLSPALWVGDSLRLEVRLRLLRTALAFYRFVDLPHLAISDIIMTGSSAAYNYTPLSDIDVHLVVDYRHTVCPDLAENFFGAKKTLWNKSYHVTIRGLTVELYIEDSQRPAQSNGVYSLLQGRWLKHASPTPPARDDFAVVRKTEHLAAEVDDLLAAMPNAAAIDAMLARLKKLRQNGLLRGGEFSTENLTFKSLRNFGLLDRLWDARADQMAADLSLA